MTLEKVSKTINDNEEYKNLSSLHHAPIKRVMPPGQAEDLARYIMQKLGASGDSWEFYCKVAYHLPQPTIDRLVTTALEKGREPAKLFNYLARKEMGEV
jgi:rubrerythrin